MPSTEKTSVLQLNLWSSTDKPKRADFVSDNEKLEKYAGAHIANADLHLNDQRKLLLDEPYAAVTYTGTGTAQKAMQLEFSPRIVIVFAHGKPSVLVHDGYTEVFAGILYADTGSAQGMTSMEDLVSFSQTQQTPAAGGVCVSLNKTGVTYTVLAFR